MNELAVRGALVYGGLSFAIFALKNIMVANGIASRWNPAWQLISSIYSLFSWSWYLALLSAAIVIAAVVIAEILPRIGDNVRKKKEGIRAAELEKERAIQREIEAKRDRSRKTKELIKTKREKEARERKEEEYRQYLRNRTPIEAVERALDDFCKGD